jgi:uncharacterized membrane protein
MFSFMPNWDALHPLVVHFPIALFFVAPIFVIIGLFIKQHGRGFQLSALVLMIIGTISAYVTTSTGESAAELVERTGALVPVLDAHIEMGETVRNIFLVLTIIYAAILLGPQLLKKQLSHSRFMLVNVVFLLLYAVGMYFLADEAHQGGRLVHEFGVHAMMGGAPAKSAKPAFEDSEAKKDVEMEKKHE